MKLLKKTTLALAVWLACTALSLAQTARITTSSLSGNVACAGNSVAVSFVATNLVVANRSFTVQLSNAAGSFSTPIPLGIGRSSPISVIIPANTTLNSGYKLRVVTDTTNVEYLPSNAFTLLSRPTATLSGGGSINAGDSATLTVAFSGSGPWTYTFTNTNTGTTNINPLLGVVKPNITTTYALQSVSNGCGAGTVSGTATVVVVPRVSTAAYSPGQVCAGSNLSIPFVVTGAFSSAASYTAQLSDAAGNFTNPVNLGTAAVSPIAAVLPANTPSGANYRVRVVANLNATTVASAAFSVRPLPTATLSGTATINVGETANLTMIFTGDAPWTYRLTDGTNGTANTSPFTLAVKPTLSTTYALQSVSNACGNGTATGSVRVSVVPRISTADLTLSSVCVGTNVSVPFSITGAFEQPTTYTVQLSDAAGSFTSPINLGSGTASPVAVTLPINLTAGVGYRLRVVAAVTATSVSSAAFGIRVRPTANLGGNLTINFGETANLTLNFTGESPWNFTLSDGSTGVASSTPFAVTVRPSQTSNYALTAVSNLCGAGITSGTASVTVIPRLITEDPTATVCVGSNIDVRFGVGGVLPNNTTYQVQLSDSTGSFTNATLLATGSRSPIAVVIPATVASGNRYRLRVLASSIANANALPSNAFAIRRRATATLSGGGNFAIKPGDELVLIAQLTGDAPWTVVLSDNTTYTATTSPLLMTVKPNFPTTYTLQSVSNGCGAGTVAGSAVANVVITNLEDQTAASLVRVYPNPTTDGLRLRVELPKAQTGEWQLCDATGKIVQQQHWQNQANYQADLWLKDLPAGMYVLRVRVGEQWLNRKITKQ
jgi:Secretion system C-terminal sorting domain